MWPDRVSNPGPLTCESGALPTALRGPAFFLDQTRSRGSIVDNTLDYQSRGPKTDSSLLGCFGL